MSLILLRLFTSVSEFRSNMYTWSCVGGMHMQEPMGLLDSTVKLVKLQKRHPQGSGNWCTRFLHCAKILAGLDHLDVLYTGVHIYCNL